MASKAILGVWIWAVAMNRYLGFAMRHLNCLISGLTLLICASIAGCGGGSGAGTGVAGVKLNGVTAVGTPIVNGVITVICADTTRLNTSSGMDGSWSVTVSGQAFPCAVEVSLGTISSIPNTASYHTVVTGSGTANITPLTDFIVANLTASATPSTWFNTLTPAVLKTITINQINTATANVAAAFPVLPNISSTNNPITTPFSAITPNPMDDSLIALSVAINNTPSVTYASLLNGVSTATVSAPYAPAGFAAALANGYAGTTSGSTSGTTSSYVAQGGLTWMPVTFGDTWTNASAYCANSTINGQTGWRLPTIAELNALYSSGAMNGRGWTLGFTWTSELDGPFGGVHRLVDLSSGTVNGYLDVQTFGVTCVR